MHDKMIVKKKVSNQFHRWMNFVHSYFEKEEILCLIKISVFNHDYFVLHIFLNLYIFILYRFISL